MTIETETRHASQAMTIKELNNIARVIGEMPPHVHVSVHCNTISVWVLMADFRAMYAGREVLEDDDGTLSIRVDGVTIKALGEKYDPKPKRVTI